MGRSKKKTTGVAFIYPGFPTTTLPEGLAWSLFHREVDVGMEHDLNSAACWCSPICIPTDMLDEELTYDEWDAIVHTSKQ